MDLDAVKHMLDEKWGSKANNSSEFNKSTTGNIRDVDVMSYAMYPQVYDEFMENVRIHGELSYLDTVTFLTGMSIGQELSVTLEKGKELIIKLISVGESNADGIVNIQFEVNGQPRMTHIKDKSVLSEVKTRAKASKQILGSVGAPMSGVVLETKVNKGDIVKVGDPLMVLSAMKMETVVASPASGKVVKIEITAGDHVDANDLLVDIEEN